MTSGRPLQGCLWLHSLYLPLVLDLVHTPLPCVFANISAKPGVAARTQVTGIEKPDDRHTGQNLLWRCFFPGTKSGSQAGTTGLPWNRHKLLNALPQHLEPESSILDLGGRMLTGEAPSMVTIAAFPRGEVRALLASLQERGATVHAQLANVALSSRVSAIST